MKFSLLLLALIYFLGLQQQLLVAQLQQKLTQVNNLTGCGSPDTSLTMDEIQLLLQETINPYLNLFHGPVCGCGGPGWTTLINLDMNDTSQSCPTSDWRLIKNNIVRACGRTAPGCQSATFSSGGVSYSQVCGRILAIQLGHPDGLWHMSRGIEGTYVDGVSITHGESPRQHIWTFVGNVGEHAQFRHAHCPCTNKNVNIPNSAIPSWIGNNYFCDTANTADTHPRVYFPKNPLWDGEGCSSVNSCCKQNNPPWFCASLPNPTTDSLEVRLCGDEVITQEDTVITRMEIHVK